MEVGSYDRSVGCSVVDLNSVIKVTEEGLEEGGESPSSEEELAGPATSEDEKCRLVMYQDNISEEEFQQMLGGGGGRKEQRKRGGRLLTALILTPTRELALQVKDHITAATKYTSLEVCTCEHMQGHLLPSRLLSSSVLPPPTPPPSPPPPPFSTLRCVQWLEEWL